MDLKAKVEEIVQDFITKGWPFTALDISNAIKREDGFGGTRHREVAPIVRNLHAYGIIMQSGYEQELIDVVLSNGDKRKAFLYRHWSVDSNSYTDRCQTAIPPKSFKDDKLGGATIDNVMDQKQDTVKVTTQDNIVQVNTDNQIKRAQKYDHRLEVPASWVDAVGLSGTVYAVKETTRLVLKNASDVSINEDVVGTMTVNNDGRLRVTKRVLDRTFVSSSSGNELLVSKGAKSIIVEED